MINHHQIVYKQISTRSKNRSNAPKFMLFFADKTRFRKPQKRKLKIQIKIWNIV